MTFSNFRITDLFAISCTALLCTSCSSGNQRYTPIDYEDCTSIELSNCRQEIATLQARTQTLELLISDLENKQDSSQISELEDEVSRLREELSSLHSDSSSNSTALGQYRDALIEMESDTHGRQEKIGQIEDALKIVLDTMQEQEAGKNTIAALDLSTSSDGSRVYTVVAGDTLEKIARRFDSSVQDIKMVNSLEREDFIIVGQKLQIP